MKALLFTMIGIVLLISPVGKAAIQAKKPEYRPLEEMTIKANTLKNKVEELDSLLSTPR